MRQYRSLGADRASVEVAKEKTAREEEAFEIEKKKKLADLEYAKSRNQMSAIDYKIHSANYNEWSKQRGKIFEGIKAQQEMTGAVLEEQQNRADSVAEEVARRSPEVQQQVFGRIAEGQPVFSAEESMSRGGLGQLTPTRTGSGYGFKREVPKAPKQQKLKDTDRYQILDTATKMADEDEKIRQEGIGTPDPKTKEMTREQKIKYFMPKAKRLMYGMPDVKLPKAIRTKRAALKYVMDKYDMTREEAIESLKNLQR